MKYKLALGLSLAALLVSTTAFAAEFVSSKNDKVEVQANEAHRNLYTSGRNVNIAGNTTGDLTVAGGKITVGGTVEHNLDAVGQEIIVSNAVGGNVKVAGKKITIDGKIAGDVLAAGAEIRINNTVSGDVLVAGRSLTFGPQAAVTGKVTYYGPTDPKLEAGANVPNIEHKKANFGDLHRTKRAVHLFGTLVGTIAWILAAWLLVWLFPKRLQSLVRMVTDRVGKNMGIGLLGLILPPIAFVLLFIVLVGYYLAFIGIAAWILLLSIACLVSALWLGTKIMSWFKKSEPKVDFVSAIVGVLAFKLMMFIPILGWIVGALIFLTAFGAVIRSSYASVKANR
jgi:cytoskeletal protein CcmA (bactofilin family)